MLEDVALDIDTVDALPAFDPSPEAEACRRAFAVLLAAATPLAAAAGNLQRLSLEYQRSVRRARALQDVLLPELDRSVYEIETRLEEARSRKTGYGCVDARSVTPHNEAIGE